MEAKHVVVIQRNHKFLKELLMVDPVLDALLQDGVFTQGDYDNCKQAGTQKCEMLLEILKKKGVEGYRTLCGVLDSTQPFIKERLDGTSVEGGNSDLVFVNKLKMEYEHEKELAGKDEDIAELQSGIEDLTKQLEDKQKDYDTLEETNKKEREELMSQIEKQKEEIETLTTTLSASNHELEQCQKQRDDLKLRLQAEQEAYEFLSGSPTPQSPDREVMTQADQQTDPPERSRMCKMSTVPDCDDKQLYLLPCLHSVCKPCIDHHVGQAKQNSINCPCGREFRLEDTVADHVGRNETTYAARSDGQEKCDYFHDDHDAQAEWHCRDCDCYLCSHCRKLHNKIKRNQGHSMDEVSQTETIPIKQWLKEPYCRDHPGKVLELYDRTCRKAICMLCLKGKHQHHKNEDLGHSHQTAKLQLEEQLQKQRLKLKDVKDKIETVNSHQEKLGNKQKQLGQEVTDVSKRVAGKFLHRLRRLREEIQRSLDNTNLVVQKNLDSLHDVQSSIISTIDYTQRTLESTRREELITLTDAIHEKCDENLKRELPEDDPRDTSILLSFQGQTALEELVDTFGGLASSLDLDHIPDSQPTLQDLDLQNSLLKENKSQLTKKNSQLTEKNSQLTEKNSQLTEKNSQLTEENSLLTEKNSLLTEKNKVHEGRWRHLEHALRHLTAPVGPDSSAEGSLEHLNKSLHRQRVYEAVANDLSARPIPIYIIGDRNVISISCPKLQLDADRANPHRCHVTTDGELINSPPATQHRHSGGLQIYEGTCASTPIPFPPLSSPVTPVLHTPRYWETQSRVGVVRGGLVLFVLEMGVCEESQVDSEMYVCWQHRSWGVAVVSCDTHRGWLCASVWQQGKEGKCDSNTMSDTPGTQATLNHGVVLDVGRGRLAFIDLDRELVLAKVDVEWSESLRPMFGVGRPDYYTVTMKVISGADITMTDTKKSLIYDALK